MPKIQTLNKELHSNLKIISEYGTNFEDSYMAAITFPSEIRQAQAYYPIVFQKDAQSGEFIPVTLFGFEQNENLFQNDTEWCSSYIPLSVQRNPFSISMKDDKLFVSIDIEHKKVSNTQGNNLFDVHGAYSKYLERMSTILEAIHHGMTENEDFVQLLELYDLIEPFTLDIQLQDGTKNQLIGFYTINEDAFLSLDSEAFSAIRKSGFLETIYMVIASQAQISKLVD